MSCGDPCLLPPAPAVLPPSLQAQSCLWCRTHSTDAILCLPPCRCLPLMPPCWCLPDQLPWCSQAVSEEDKGCRTGQDSREDTSLLCPRLENICYRHMLTSLH